MRRFSRLETRALRALRLTARTHACGRTSQTPSRALAFSGFDPGFGAGEGAAGALGPVRDAKSPWRESSRQKASTGGEPLFDIRIPREAGEAMQVLLMAMGALLLVAFLFAGQLELRPRRRQWRGRWMRRPPGEARSRRG
jgi:hypothetical protein